MSRNNSETIIYFNILFIYFILKKIRDINLMLWTREFRVKLCSVFTSLSLSLSLFPHLHSSLCNYLQSIYQSLFPTLSLSLISCRRVRVCIFQINLCFSSQPYLLIYLFPESIALDLLLSSFLDYSFPLFYY